MPAVIPGMGHHVGKLLAKCNGMKEKGVSPVSLLRYKLSNIFVGRSMYMQQRTGSVLEMADITFSRLLGILMDALMASLQEILKLSDEQLTAFTADFEARLPKYLRNALHPESPS